MIESFQTARRTAALCLAAFTAAVSAPGGDLRSGTNRYDYVIVAPSSFTGCMQTLADFRQAHDGLLSLVVPIDSIVTQFGTGIRPDSALKDFIRCALTGWKDPKPRYFLLAGNVNCIPSHFEPEQLVDPEHAVYDSLFIDEWFVESTPSAGSIPRILASIGRLPACDSSAAGVMVSKILQYEEDPADSWSSRALCLADYRQGEGEVFEYDARLLSSALAKSWPDTITVHIREDSPLHRDGDEFRRLWNQGAAIAAYCGHANPQELSSSCYLDCCNADSLCNGRRLPLALLGGCDLRFDGNCGQSVPVNLLLCARGGAIAVVASEGLIYESDVEYFLASLIEQMTGHPELSAGEAFTTAKNNAGNPFILRRYTFLGDPALHIKYNPATLAIPQPSASPGPLSLDQNYPNPFNPTTTIRYFLPLDSHVTLKLYTSLGQEAAVLVHADQPAGPHAVRLDGSALSSGVYFYRLEAGSHTMTRRCILVK
jgi:hypothetical protein